MADTVAPRTALARAHDRAAGHWLVLCCLGIAATAPFSAPAFSADAGRGRMLYENHCQQCHTPNIHSRAKKLPLDRNELRVIVDDWRRQINLPWTPAETEDVVEYLNRTRYRFAPD
jgi:mono/diheme cytochrome c family protein